MRVEGQHRGVEREVVRGLREAREHGLVPEVDTVEIPDGQRDVAAGDLGQAAEELHRGVRVSRLAAAVAMPKR